MTIEAFATHLSTLDEAELTGLLAARPDVLVEPAPRGFRQLAQRLDSAESVTAALEALHRDELVVSQLVAVLGPSATEPKLTEVLAAPAELTAAALARLRGLGLLWEGEGALHLTPVLTEQWAGEFGVQRPFRTIAKTALAGDLRVMAAALGITVDGLRKPELIDALDAVLADVRRLTAVVAALPHPVRAHLQSRWHGYFGGGIHFGSPAQGKANELTEQLVRAGLLLRVHGQPALAKEVAVVAWLAGAGLSLTGPPVLARPGPDRARARALAQAAAQDTLRGVAALLDAASLRPVAALKKGGVGQRERARLAAELSVPGELLALWLDLAHAAGLLDQADPGYVPTTGYPAWRSATAGERWAALAVAWFELEHAPTSREEDEGVKEEPPPLLIESRAGALRRALLTAARDGASVRAAGTEIDWYCPLHDYPPPLRQAKVDAALREAEALGIVAEDVLSELGEHLLAEDASPVPLPEERCTVVLQSDLTAVVSGQPDAATAQLLAASAVREARGAATVWRFSPDSVRAALDAGWTAEELTADLAGVSGRELPQPLAYLVHDAARRHGQVRVRHVSCCLVADEPTVTEILHTRSLRPLKLSRLAPTVLSSPRPPAEVLTALRAAGLSPVAEDAQGTVVVEPRTGHQVEACGPVPLARTALTAGELAKRLLADPAGSQGGPVVDDTTLAQLARLNSHLSEAELAILTDAVTNQHDLLITYCDKRGRRTVREIQPVEIYGKWLAAWCYLRDDEREFTIANIESVAPAGT
ncbi:hypothetical protein JOF53_003296 [Crossiella equi]|uniref:Helicase XPB/Ssl2 N-terminal domain-containing protein n=1 Tax=Crossiella equi TaxID=130796 RepID=A0ABS5ACV7_9PSEU|nr:helicase-associated domain-containing protein [Crossiella equi]MBP2474424.1 hypothetical protein [Crossiella equi]